MKTKIYHYIKLWIPLAVAITLMSGLVCVATRQNLRLSANDPQIQISEDISSALANGAIASQLNQNTKVDISKSLSTYIIIYDDKGTPIASTGVLDGDVPKPPAGVFDYVRDNGEDRITWEPQADVRSAIIIRPYSTGDSSGFVLVGRSLRETDKRIKTIGLHILYGWVASLILAMFSLVAVEWVSQRLNRPLVPTSEPSVEPSVDL